jgi:hypothetical protein
MMRKTLDRRVKSIERQIITPAERKAFLDPAPRVVLAYYAGNPQPNEPEPWAAFVRALKYPDGAEYDGLKRDSDAELKRRYDNALRPVFQKFGFDYFPHEKWEEGITKLAEQLPPEWRGLIQRDEYEAGLDPHTLFRLIRARFKAPSA